MNRSALDWLGNPASDYAREALLSGEDPGALVEATDIGITVEKGGIHVRARSPGKSLVVIPFQFSHCLRVTAKLGQGTPQLGRSQDLLLTGILFEGDLDTFVAYRQGPFWGRGTVDFAISPRIEPSWTHY